MPRFCSMKKTRYTSVPISEWPEADRALFRVESVVDDPFAPVPPMAAFKEGRRQSIERVNAIWLAFLRDTDPERLDQPPQARITADPVAAFERCLAEDGLADFTRLYYLERLRALAGAAAPQTDWSWFDAAFRKLRRSAKPVRHKPVVEIGQILRLGIELMDEARAGGGLSEFRAARQYRDGLILAFWSARPLRLKNFAGVDIDLHLHFDGDVITVQIPGEEVKNGMTDERVVPEALAPYLRDYLNEIRSKLPGAGSHRKLWASALRRPMSPAGVAAVIKRLSRNRLGVRLSPQNVRHSAGTSIAIATPTKAKIAMAVLCQRRLATASTYYNMATSIDAQRQTTANLLAVRKRLCAGRRTRAKLRPRF